MKKYNIVKYLVEEYDYGICKGNRYTEKHIIKDLTLEQVKKTIPLLDIEKNHIFEIEDKKRRVVDIEKEIEEIDVETEFKTDNKQYKLLLDFGGEELESEDNTLYYNFDIVEEWINFEGYGISKTYINYDNVIEDLLEREIIKEI